MFIFSNNKYFAILLGRFGVACPLAASRLDKPWVRSMNKAEEVGHVIASSPGLIFRVRNERADGRAKNKAWYLLQG